MVTGGHKTSRQFNKMMRARMMDSDGFTYVYGAVKMVALFAQHLIEQNPVFVLINAKYVLKN